MGMGFAPTWLRQMSPAASQNHFNDWEGAVRRLSLPGLCQLRPPSRRIRRKSAEKVRQPAEYKKKIRLGVYVNCTVSKFLTASIWRLLSF